MLSKIICSIRKSALIALTIQLLLVLSFELSPGSAGILACSFSRAYPVKQARMPALQGPSLKSGVARYGSENINPTETVSLFLVNSITSQTAESPAKLELGNSVQRDLKGGQKHSYLINLKRGEYILIAVAQLGIDVVLRWLGPDGKQIEEFDSDARANGEEKTVLVGETDAIYTLIVEARQQNALPAAYSVRFIESRPATEQERAIQEARRLFTESQNQRRAGKYDQARELGEKSLSIREKWLGKEHLELAAPLTNIALIYKDLADFEAAEKSHLRALAIREKALGPDHTSVSTSLNNLALLYKEMGNLDKTEQLQRRALAIFEKVLAPDHPNVGFMLGNLAEVARMKGDLAHAEMLNRRAIEILEKAFGPSSREVAISVNNLANTYKEKGDYEEAEPLYRRALAILESSMGPNHPNVAAPLGNLAEIARHRRDYAAAESLNQRVLQIFQKGLGPNHPNVGLVMSEIGVLHRLRGDLEKAEETYKQSLALLEKEMGPEHPYVGAALSNVGLVFRDKGEFARALSMFERSLSIRQKALGPQHPDVAESFENLAMIQACLGAADKAVEAQTHANAITERNVSLNLVTGSERQKLIYLRSLSDATDRTLSLHINTAPTNSHAQEIAATAILRRKGRVLDTMADSLAAVRQRLTEKDGNLLDDFRDTNSLLARLVFNGPQRISMSEHQKRIKTLEEKREKLEAEISIRSAGFYQPRAGVTLEEIQSSIPPDAALIEFSTYQPFDAKAPASRQAFGEPRYVAYVIRRDGKLNWKDLGPASEVDKVVDSFRETLRDPKRSDVRTVARFLATKIIQPLEDYLIGTSRLLISPDGALTLIPFEALVNDKDRYMVEAYAFTYLTSGRDLIRMQVKRSSKTEPIILANPLFGEPEVIASAPSGPGRRTGAARAYRERARRSVTRAKSLTDVYFAPLTGTGLEAESIKMLFTESRVLTGSKASESALKRISAPRILHIATHGFFLADPDVPSSSAALKQAGEAGSEPTRSINSNVRVENPLLRSGLALAGANVRKAGDDDGILPALEASGLDLWGTKLVTLSACDTGIGEVEHREGVYGLRRSFVLAGAETLVMSLWPVSDYATREIMTGYYRGLRQGGGRGEALREVQLAMIRNRQRSHPFYWASFIQSGEWGNLDGVRQ